MTEEQAKTKWCPFSRLLAHTYSQDGQGRSYEGGYSYNRSPDPDDDRGPYLPDGALCIGSACMAWRSSVRPNEWLAEYDGQPAQIGSWDPSDSPAYAGKVKVLERVAQGFCGLAGAPQ